MYVRESSEVNERPEVNEGPVVIDGSTITRRGAKPNCFKNVDNPVILRRKYRACDDSGYLVFSDPPIDANATDDQAEIGNRELTIYKDGEKEPVWKGHFVGYTGKKLGRGIYLPFFAEEGGR